MAGDLAQAYSATRGDPVYFGSRVQSIALGEGKLSVGGTNKALGRGGESKESILTFNFSGTDLFLAGLRCRGSRFPGALLRMISSCQPVPWIDAGAAGSYYRSEVPVLLLHAPPQPGAPSPPLLAKHRQNDAPIPALDAGPWRSHATVPPLHAGPQNPEMPAFLPVVGSRRSDAPFLSKSP